MVTRGGSATANQIEAEVDLGGRRGIEVPALVENHPSIDREKQPVPQGLQPRFPAVQFRIGGGHQRAKHNLDRVRGALL